MKYRPPRAVLPDSFFPVLVRPRRLPRKRKLLEPSRRHARDGGALPQVKSTAPASCSPSEGMEFLYVCDASAAVAGVAAALICDLASNCGDGRQLPGSTSPTRAPLLPENDDDDKSASDSAESEPQTSDRTASMTQGADGK